MFCRGAWRSWGDVADFFTWRFTSVGIATYITGRQTSRNLYGRTSVSPPEPVLLKMSVVGQEAHPHRLPGFLPSAVPAPAHADCHLTRLNDRSSRLGSPVSFASIPVASLLVECCAMKW